MTNITSDSLAKYLGAVEVAPGRYAFRVDDTEMHEAFALWGICDAADLIGGGDGPSRWVQMPPWWSPEQRFALRGTRLEATDYFPAGSTWIAGVYEHPQTTTDHAFECITASLETGEEIPS